MNPREHLVNESRLLAFATGASRRVGKAEYLAKGENPRFVVTSLTAEQCAAQPLYEQEYCARGEMENRIKEQQLYLFADRTSSHTMRANQLRLWLSSIAYLLLSELRRRARHDTGLATAQCDTIRLKLLKIGAQVARQRPAHLAARGQQLPLPAGISSGVPEPHSYHASSCSTKTGARRSHRGSTAGR